MDPNILSPIRDFQTSSLVILAWLCRRRSPRTRHMCACVCVCSSVFVCVRVSSSVPEQPIIYPNPCARCRAEPAHTKHCQYSLRLSSPLCCRSPNASAMYARRRSPNQKRQHELRGIFITAICTHGIRAERECGKRRAGRRQSVRHRRRRPRRRARGLCNYGPYTHSHVERARTFMIITS